MTTASPLATPCSRLVLALLALTWSATTFAAAPRELRRTATAKATIDQPAARRAQLALAASGPAPAGPYELRSADLSLLLDAFGAFGSSSAGGDALFDDGEQTSGTVFEYMAHASGIGFLDGESRLLPQSAADSHQDGQVVTSSYELGAFRFDVRSELLDCEDDHCAVLVQDWSATNLATEETSLVLSFYLDGDLFFAGDFRNDYGARSDASVYQYDEGANPSAPSSFLGVSSEAADALRSSWEVGEYSELRQRLRRGGLLLDRLSRADGSAADADADEVTDEGYDVSLARAHDFGRIAPGETVQVQVSLQWGIGALDELVELVPDAGGDRLAECEGPDGTVLTLDGSGSEPADKLVAHRWSVDGEPVGEGPLLDVILLPGDHAVVLEVEDAHGRTASDAATITVQDTSPPSVSVGDPVVLWPPDKRLVEVEPPVDLHDACDDPVLILLSVTSDEIPKHPYDPRAPRSALSPRSARSIVPDGRAAELGLDPDRAPAVLNGKKGPFALLSTDGRLFLRRERDGKQDGRVYRVHGEVVDGSGNARAVSFEVHVPLAHGEPVIDSGVKAAVVFR